MIAAHANNYLFNFSLPEQKKISKALRKMHLYEKNKPLINFISGNDLFCLQCCNFTHKDGQINYLMFKKVGFGELSFFFKGKRKAYKTGSL